MAYHSSTSLDLLRALTEAHSVSGFEQEVREIFEQELAGHGDFTEDRLGSIVCQGRRNTEEPHILVAGHMDEVGFRVQGIHPKGFLTFVPLGGWWGHNLLSQRVTVKTRTGKKFTGVIASKPPHFLSKAARNQVMEIEQMFIDIGASSREEVEEWGIRVGDPIAPQSKFEQLGNENRLLAKAFDNRVGMAAAIQVGQAILAESAHLSIAGTVQEEVGLRGAKTLANLLSPDFAIILEGPPADDVIGDDLAMSQGTLGKGVQIRLHDPSAIMDPKLVELAIEAAEAESIPYQVTVRRSGGTDAGSFHLANSGIPSIVLGVPARYIHSHNSIIDLQDYQAMISLTKALVNRLALNEAS